MRMLKVFLLLVVVTAAWMTATGCMPPAPSGTGDPNASDPNGTVDPNGTTPTGLTIVKTNIDVRHDSALKVGDDLIAFGQTTNGSSIVGVYYVVPSTSPTAATPVTNPERYDNSAFAVGGKTIFLAGANTGPLAYQVSVYDTTTAAITKTFTTAEIRLGTIPAAASDPGNIQADGDYCAVICDQNTVTDGKIIKVIDVSGGTPALISFATNPASSHFQVDQVAVDAATKRVVAVADDTFFVYSITAPNAAPVQIAAPDGIGDTQIAISGNYVIALDDQAYPEAFLVNLSTHAVLPLTNALAINQVDISSSVFAFFADADVSDGLGGWQRAAVGTVPGPGSTKAALGNQIDGSTNNNGLVGFAAGMSIVPDGSYVFLSDSYLQYSAGNASFTVPADPDGTDPYGCPAWDVESSDNTVGFKTASTTTGGAANKLGYIVLP